MSRLKPRHEPAYWLGVTEEDACALAAGRVTPSVQQMAQTLTDWSLEDLRKNAAKPVQLTKAKTRKSA